eukprot:IDg6529t1
MKIGPTWAQSCAAEAAFKAPWAPNQGCGLSGVVGDLATSFAHDVSCFQVEVHMSEEFRKSVNGRVLRRGIIYTASQARVVRSMLFEINWEEPVCAKFSRGLLRTPIYSINSFIYEDERIDFHECRIYECYERVRAVSGMVASDAVRVAVD